MNNSAYKSLQIKKSFVIPSFKLRGTVIFYNLWKSKKKIALNLFNVSNERQL